MAENDDAKIPEAKSILERFAERRARALKRLHDDEGRALIYVGLLGIEVGQSPCEIAGICLLRAVEDPPGEIELASALADKSMLAAVARYSPYVRYELCVERKVVGYDVSPLTLAWWLVSALRIKANSDFLAAIACSHSWSTVAAVSPDTCEVSLPEDVPKARSFAVPVPITQADFDWVSANLDTFTKLIERPRFRLAVDSLTTHPHEASLRMTTASLWAGIEAIFAINSELTFRVSAYLAAFLEEPGAARLAMCRRVRSLYAFRSKAVHGASVKDEDIISHVREVRVLLCRLLRKAIEQGHVPEGDEWDEVLLSR